MRISVNVAFAVLLVARCGLAQEAAPSGAQAEHEWLQKFAGEWVTKSKASGADGDEFHATGTMASRMIGGLWVVSDLTGDVNGMTFTAVQTLGYDPQKKKYVGTWIDSFMNHMWIYEGTVDEAGNKLTLEAKGPNFTDGKMGMFRDAYEFKTPDHIVATSSMKTEDGTWVTFMTGEFRRKKASP